MSPSIAHGGTGRLATWLAALAVIGGACGADDTGSVEISADAGCDELADMVPDLAVDLADHAARSSTGIPPSAFDAERPEDVDVWELAAALASGSAELEARVEAVDAARREAGCEPGWAHPAVEQRVEAQVDARRGQTGEESFDREAYRALNLLAILSANLAPPERFDVPDGFPTELPVHPEARLTSSERDAEGSLTATWIVEGGSFEEVSSYYSERLQEVRFGGWTVSGSSGSGGTSAEGAETGREAFDVHGYGFAGQVTVEGGDAAGAVTVTASLAPSGQDPPASPGMTSSSPGWIRSGSEMPFSSTSASTLVSNRSAIWTRVSPGSIV